MMPNNPFYSGRIPKELDEHVKKYVHQTGKTKTKVLIEALSHYTNFENPELNRQDNKQNHTKQKIDELEKKINELEKKINENILLLDHIYGIVDPIN